MCVCVCVCVCVFIKLHITAQSVCVCVCVCVCVPDCSFYLRFCAILLLIWQVLRTDFPGPWYPTGYVLIDNNVVRVVVMAMGRIAWMKTE